MAADFDIDFVAFQTLTAAEMDTMADNDRALQDWSGFDNGTFPIALLPNSSITPDKLDTGATVASNNSDTGTTTSTSFTATLDSGGTNPAVTVTIGANGLALVLLTGNVANSTANTAVRMGFAVSGANTIAASDSACMQHADPTANSPEQGSWGILLTGLTPGSTTFTLQYRVSAGTGSYTNRSISVLPL